MTTKGIQRQLTVAGTPHQNGVAERKNRTLLETARSIFLSANFPPHLWQEAVRTANYVRNRCGTRPLNLTSPYEVLTGHKPDVSHFRVIECSAFVFLPKENREGKLQATNYGAVLLGYDDNSKAYCLYEPTRRHIIVSHQVEFLEQQLGDFGTRGAASDVFAPLFDAMGILVDAGAPDAAVPAGIPLIPLAPIGAPILDIEPGAAPPDPTVPDEQHAPDAPAALAPLPLDAPPQRYPTRQRRPPSRDRLYYRTDDFSLVVESSEPVCDKIGFSQAITHTGWHATMQEEYDSLLSTHTWDLGPLPLGQHALSSKWVYKTKPEMDDTRFRLKARLVARGFEQQFGVDFEETFAPVVKWSTLCSVIALSVALGWELHHMDIITAFLNGVLAETVYMKQPPGFAVPGSEHLVCCLRRSLYGLKQSPRTWYQQFPGEIAVKYINTHQNPADMFTKQLNRLKFDQHTSAIGIISESGALHHTTSSGTSR